MVALAARAALRVLPVVQEALRHKPTYIALPVFCALTFAWTAARYSIPTKGYAAPPIDLGAFGLASSAATSAGMAAQAALVSVSKPSLAAAVFDCADDIFASARAAISSTATASTLTDAIISDGMVSDAELDFWSAVSFDATVVESGAVASDIASSPLWPRRQPDWLQILWQEMKAALDAEKQDWDVWTDWYEARLAGKRSNQKLEIARAMISNEIWKEGPAKVNAEIKELIKKHKPPPRQKKKPKPSIVPKTSHTLPVPIENVPSAVSFGWSSKGTIAVVSGAFNWPVFPFKGGEEDHRNRLEACRTLATDMAHTLRSGRWNARTDYSETLDQYAAYLPAQPDEGNFLLADAEARVIRAMFAAEQDFLPAPLAAKLKVLLEQHIGLRAYYPATEDFYASVRSGHLEAPLPIDAVEKFIQVVRDNTPSLFEPNVSQSLDRIAQPLPTISPVDADVPRANSAQPMPPPDPLGPLDPIQEWRFVVASGANAIWKVVKFGPVAYAGVESWSKIIETLGPHAAPIIAWLRSYLGV